MMLYLSSNTRPYIYFTVQQCARFTHNTKASNETSTRRICRYLQGNKDKGLVFYPSKKLVMNVYADADFVPLWRHENPQDPICYRIRTGFVINFTNCLLPWVSKIQTEIALSTLRSGYVALYHSVRELLTLKILIKEVIDNLRIVSDNLKFVSSSTVYKDNNVSIVVATSPMMTTSSNHFSVKYHWFRQHTGKEFLIWKINS